MCRIFTDPGLALLPSWIEKTMDGAYLSGAKATTYSQKMLNIGSNGKSRFAHTLKSRYLVA